MKRFLSIACALFLCGCTHLFWDSTERLQLKNLSDSPVCRFSIVGASDTIPWVRDTVQPGKLSFVHERDFVGSFHAVFWAQDSTGRWEVVDLGRLQFDGGSEILSLSKRDGEWRGKFE